MKHYIPIIGLLLAAVCGHAAEVSLNPPVFLPDGQEFKTWPPRTVCQGTGRPHAVTA